jgi:hypothetical protein
VLCVGEDKILQSDDYKCLCTTEDKDELIKYQFYCKLEQVYETMPSNDVKITNENTFTCPSESSIELVLHFSMQLIQRFTA